MRRELDLGDREAIRQPRAIALAELREDLMRSAFQAGDFTLASGVRRTYYFNKYLFVSRPGILRRLGRYLGELVPPDTDRLAAPALGAVALGTAVSLELGVPLVIVRPQVTQSPEVQRIIEGGLYGGERVVLVEDVVVTGNRASRAISHLVGEGAEVTDVVAVLDCLEGAGERFAAASIAYSPLFTIDEFGIEP
jgi:orotate phosphoribosyltransferase